LCGHWRFERGGVNRPHFKLAGLKPKRLAFVTT
jgi:hypothetical protein